MPSIDVIADALIEAADGVTRTVAAVRDLPLPSADPGRAALADGRLADVVTGFCRRWQRALSDLVDDGDQYATHLRQTASSYLGVDVEAAAAFLGIGS